MKKLCSIIALLLVLLTVGNASAQNDPELMKQKVDLALKAFNTKEYKKAAELFREAFDAYPDINLKKNEMVAWFKAGICRDAIDAGERFIQSDNADDVDRRDFKNVKIRCDIIKANGQIEIGNLEGAENFLVSAEQDHGDVEPEDQSKIDDIRTQIAELRARQETEQPKTIVYRKPAWALVLGSAGIALGAAAVILVPTVWTNQETETLETAYVNAADGSGIDGCEYNVETSSFSAECNVAEFREDNAEFADLETQRKNTNLGQGVTLGAGILGIVGGAALIAYYVITDGTAVEVESSTDVEATFLPVIQPNYAGGSFTVRF